MDRGTVAGLVELTRPGNSLLAGALTFVGAFVAGGAGEAPVAVGAAVAATVAATAAGMAINDYFDRDVDRINNPERAIPRGAVSPRGALALAVALFLAAVALAVTLPPIAIAIAAFNLAALIAYTELFKGLPGVGNAVVAYLGGSTFLFGAAAARSLGAAPVVLFLLAALSTLSREIIKDVEDAPGDREEGLRTLPIVVGERRSLWLAAALLAVAVAASPLPYLRGTLGVAYLALVVPADGLMLSATAVSFSEPGRGHRRLKYGMGLAAAAFVVGRGVAIA